MRVEQFSLVLGYERRRWRCCIRAMEVYRGVCVGAARLRLREAEKRLNQDEVEVCMEDCTCRMSVAACPLQSRAAVFRFDASLNESLGKVKVRVPAAVRNL